MGYDLALTIARPTQVHHDVDAHLCQGAKSSLGRLTAAIQSRSRLAEVWQVLAHRLVLPWVLGGRRRSCPVSERSTARHQHDQEQCKHTDRQEAPTTGYGA